MDHRLGGISRDKKHNDHYEEQDDGNCIAKKDRNDDLPIHAPMAKGEANVLIKNGPRPSYQFIIFVSAMSILTYLLASPSRILN